MPGFQTKARVVTPISGDNLRLCKPKDPLTKEQRTDPIYSIPCNDCDNEYIGLTKRQFGTRLEGHQKAVVLYRSTHA